MKMTSEKIMENLKKYIENEIKFYDSRDKIYGVTTENLLNKCYGAVKFSTYLLSSKDCESICDWWDNAVKERIWEKSHK